MKRNRDTAGTEHKMGDTGCFFVDACLREERLDSGRERHRQRTGRVLLLDAGSGTSQCARRIESEGDILEPVSGPAARAQR